MGVRKELDLLLKDSEKAVLDVMQSNLAFIGDSLINKVVAKESGLSNAKKLDAIKGIDASGLNQYKDDLLDVLTIISYETLRQTKKEIPKAKYELSEKDILVEDWGGKVQMLPISALQKKGIDELLDAVNLESEMQELNKDNNSKKEMLTKILELN